MPSIAPKVDRRGLHKAMEAAVRREMAASAAEKYKRDLWALMTEVGGVNVVEGLVTAKDRQPCLSIEFHKPLIDWRSDMRRRRMIGKGKDTLALWPREFCKTTVMIWESAQDLLNDPMTTIVWWHAVEDQAGKACLALSTILQTHKELRKLFPPGTLPTEKAKKFISGTGFKLPCNRSGTPTFQPFGWSSEATGAHAKYGKLDDIISRGIIEDNQLPKVASWYQNTVCNVVMASGWKDAIGTRWDVNDQYATWLKSANWECMVRAAIEDESGKPDVKGKPVYMDMTLLDKKREEMQHDFAPQMMNDPSPAGEKPWSQDCERFMPKKEAETCAGTVVIITDPAPARVGSFELGSGTNYKGLGGEKDEWATAVLKLRRVGDRREIILLYGDSSKLWDTDMGFERMAQMAYSFKARRYAIEKTGQAVVTYDNEFQKAKRKVGVSGCSEIELETTYKGKNPRFGLLCSRAKAGEFFISEGCPKTVVDKFLDQARTWRPMGSKNGLREDGIADCISYACDPAFEFHYATVPVSSSSEEGFDPYGLEQYKKRRASMAQPCRYIRFGA